MQGLTRRAALQGGLGAGLAMALSTLLPPAPALAAVTNRVRQSTGSAYGARRTSVPVTFPAPAPGNLLLAVVAVDGSAGAFKAPAGWRIAFQRVGTSLSLAAFHRVGTGAETGVTVPWTTSSPGGSWVVAEYTGIDVADPLGPLRNPAYNDAVRSSMALDPPVAESGSIQLAVFGIDSMDPLTTGGAGSEFRPTATGWGWVTTGYDAAQTLCPGAALTEYGAPLAAGQDLPKATFSWLRRDQVIGAVLQLNTRPITPALVSRWVGAVTPTGATVAVKLARASTARLKVATDTGLTTDVSFSAAAGPDAHGMAQLVVDGLVPGTGYHYAVELDGTAATTSVGSFRTAPAAAASFTFALASCCSSPGAETFREVLDHDPDLFLHLGDLHYGNIAVNDPAAYRAKYDVALASTPQAELYANVPTVYTWSDHDFGPQGGYNGSVTKPAAQAAYRQYVPSYPLPSATGAIYQSFSYGRVRFIVTDNRSARSRPGATDNAGKTMLGAEQKQWFKDQVNAAAEPVIVWVNESPWIGEESTGDWWSRYKTERAELAGFLAASGKNVAIVSGDMHALAADDGTHSPGGIPVFQAAALHGNSSHKGGPYTHGPFPTVVKQPVEQYGVMRVVDTGTEIALAFTGYAFGEGEKLAYTHTYQV